MIYKAYSSDTQRLLSLPETGMGYQIITAKFHGLTYRYVVYNSELIVELDNQFDNYKRQILARGFSAVLNESTALGIETSSISVIPKNLILETRTLSDSTKKDKHRYSGGTGAKDNPKMKATGKDTFVRLSSYPNDHRIDMARRRLREGSYSTTKEDYWDCVNFHDDPVDRYALPYDDGETVEWAFYILPKLGDTVQIGIVQPANRHYGGGIEAYFEDGTSNDTFLYRRPYGQ